MGYYGVTRGVFPPPISGRCFPQRQLQITRGTETLRPSRVQSQGLLPKGRDERG
jgi:hypothetical protein